MRRIAGTAVAAVGFAACGDVPPAGPVPLPTSCSDPGGTVHRGVVGGVWRAEDGPHRIVGTVAVASLVIEAGTLVCGGPHARITGQAVSAAGTADAPVVFAAEDPAQPWSGIGAQVVSLAHTRFQDAVIGVDGRFEVLNSEFRRIQGPALQGALHGAHSLIASVVDSACLSLCADPLRAAVELGPVRFRFEDSEIVSSGAIGLRVGWRSSVEILGGRIDGSADVGLVLREDVGRPVDLEDARPIRITGGGSYPAQVPLAVAAALLGTREDQEGWLGNARDTVIVTSLAGSARRLTVHPGLAWRVVAQTVGARIDELVLEPGAALTFDGHPPGVYIERIVSRGTAEAPVVIVAGGPATVTTPPPVRLLGGAGGDTSWIRHTRLERLRLLADGPQPILLEDVLLENSHLQLAAPGSRVTRAVLRGAPDGDAALVIGAADVEVSRCQVTGSPREGIRVETSDGVRIRDCDIHGNAGPGVRNVAADPVDARGNWWGDPAGPFGPDGDGVEGDVVFEPFQTSPVAAAQPAFGLFLSARRRLPPATGGGSGD